MGYIDETFLSSCIFYYQIINHKESQEITKYYIDETWYVGSDGHKYYPCCLLSPNVHI